MYSIGVVGHEAAKFTDITRWAARSVIREIIADAWLRAGQDKLRVVSGGCHLGGVDVWAEEWADTLGLHKLICKPATLSWEGGYKPRNLNIARNSDEVHVVVVEHLPKTYTGTRFPLCYHCRSTQHVKSGGCWTAHQAVKLGKRAVWHVIDDAGRVAVHDSQVPGESLRAEARAHPEGPAAGGVRRVGGAQPAQLEADSAGAPSGADPLP